MHYYYCDKPDVKHAAAKGIFDTFSKFEATHGDKLRFSDCAMRGCFTEMKLISCKIDSREYETSKRFACTLSDSQ